jgi:hypothetical protein
MVPICTQHQQWAEGAHKTPMYQHMCCACMQPPHGAPAPLPPIQILMLLSSLLVCREDEAAMRVMESWAFRRRVLTDVGLYTAGEQPQSLPPSLQPAAAAAADPATAAAERQP